MPAVTWRRLEEQFSGRGPGLLLAVVVIAGGFGLGLASARDASRQLDSIGRLGGFEVRSITVSGQKETSDSALVASMRLSPGATLLGLNVDETRERIEALPWVEAATVRKVLPGSLNVTVEEAQAFARWSHDGEVRLIAADGTVLADEVPQGYGALPLVAGKGANLKVAEAIDLVARHPDTAPLVAGAVLVNGRRWDLALLTGTTVRLPQGDPDAAMVRLARLVAAGALDLAGRAIVDLRLEDRTSVQLAPPVGDAPERLPGGGEADPLALMIAEGQRYDDPLARAIAEAAL